MNRLTNVLILSFRVMMINSVPLPTQQLTPKMLLQIQSPLPLLQEEMLRLQAMQLQSIPTVDQSQTLQGMQQFQNLQGVQQFQNLQGVQQFQNLQSVQQSQDLLGIQNMHALQEIKQLQAMSTMNQLKATPAIQQFQDMPAPQQLQDILQDIRPIQQLQALSAMSMNQIQPIILLLPGLRNSMANNEVLHKVSKRKDQKEHKEDDEDLESVIIDAESTGPIPTIDDNQKAIVLVPNSRFLLNSIISAIPFLPIEINVPDTIAWMYNGIVSIIGQITNPQNRSKFKHLNFQEQIKPIIVIPM